MDLIQRKKTFWLGLLGVVAIISFAVGLLGYMYVGSFARYLADDYCTAAIFFERGLVGAQKFWYLAWSGRYTFYLAVDLAELGGPKLAPILPATAIIMWLAGLIWTLLQVNRFAQIPYAIFSAVLMATFILFITVESAPDIIQSLYWRTGMLTYIAPLVLLTIYGGGVVYAQRRLSKMNGLWLAISFFVPFVAGGFSETYAVFQTVFLGFVAVCCWVSGVSSIKRVALPLVGAGLAGAIFAIVVVAIAPGNLVRQAQFPSSGWLYIFFLTIKNTLYFLYVNFSSPLILITTLLGSMLLAIIHSSYSATLRDYKDSKKLKLTLLVLPVMGGVVLATCFFPAVYGMSAYPPARALIIPQFFLICMIVSWGYFVGVFMNQLTLVSKIQNSIGGVLLSYAIVLPLLIIGPVSSLQENRKMADRAQIYAQAWDNRDNEIRTAVTQGQQKLAVSVLPYLPGDIGPDPEHWLNKCVADYYNLDSIIAQ